MLPKFGFRGDMKGVFDMLERQGMCKTVSLSSRELDVFRSWLESRFTRQEVFNRAEFQANPDFQHLG